MDSASQTLVIFLSVTLGVLLVLSIVLVAFLIGIAQQVRRITDSAERSASTVEQIISGLQRAVAPAVASQFMMDQIKRLIEAFGERRKQRESEDEKEV